jgi:hypothetical protein
MKKILLIAAIGLSLLTVVVFLIYFIQARASITVKNESGFKIYNVFVETRNNAVSLDDIANGDSRTAKLPNKFGESSIKLSFMMGDNKKQWEGGYIESFSQYSVILTVKPNGNVEFRAQLKMVIP